MELTMLVSSPYLLLSFFILFFKVNEQLLSTCCVPGFLYAAFYSFIVSFLFVFFFSFIHPMNTWLKAVIFQIPWQKVGVPQGGQESQALEVMAF